jgi:hypothetical protein
MSTPVSGAAEAPARLALPTIPAGDGAFVEWDGTTLYRITEFDRLDPFLIALTSSDDHWMYITSSGGLTAGRVSPDTALFPYETVDRLYDSHRFTGPLTIIDVVRDGRSRRWEPFAPRIGTDNRHIERNLYKDALSTMLVFEELNHELGIAFRATWQTSPRFGFVRSCRLEERSGSACSIRMLDGVQNLLPHGATQAIQRNLSNLLDAYKRSELDPSGMAIYALSSTLTDLAEASESLRATIAWQIGLPQPQILLSATQVAAFRRGEPLQPETDVRNCRGAFLLVSELDLAPGSTHAWRIVADVAQDSVGVAAIARALTDDPVGLANELATDIARGRNDLQTLVAASDGMQQSADPMATAHHAANTLFNIMRGGCPANGYTIDSADLRSFITTRRPALLQTQAAFFADLPPQLSVQNLRHRAGASGVADLERLCSEYLPFTFSRRHGDPSRPWNRFSIKVRDETGARRLDYQGNWRDLFQNWEPLGYAFPGYLESMLAVFLSATTADGYNPYRVARDGVEWEVPEPDNPWANIGYWSDHQIIYLLKLLEAAEQFEPGRLHSLLDRRIYSHVDVPYRIKSYPQLVADPADSITFDWDHEQRIMARVAEQGSDGKLLHAADGQVIHVSLAEKLLLLLLAKLVNFVPEGGIWMNTQRPEWNDANNALVGKGLSVVTLAYLRRYLAFCRSLIGNGPEELAMTTELGTLFDAIVTTLQAHRSNLSGAFSDAERRAITDALGQAGDHYRQGLYTSGLSGTLRGIGRSQLLAAFDLALAYVEHSLHANRRDDRLYHSYNTLRLEPGRAAIGRLDVMLEGQVAVLSSGLLPAAESLALLKALRTSPLYRADQQSYMLYPNRTLPGFRAKNRIDPQQLRDIALVAALEAAGDTRLLVRDVDGDYHFCGDFRNARDLHTTLAAIAHDPRYTKLVRQDSPRIAELFEQVFRHSEFTGRSGSFFAYEGLGSVYWHMVAKLLLAIQERHVQAAAEGIDPDLLAELAAAYHDVRAGLGFQKSPAAYGAFPTDPYSHTPLGRGAQQPGMTGQVKEELLTRMGELGLIVAEGRLAFRPRLLTPHEWTDGASRFSYIDPNGQPQQIELPAGSLAFTCCQTPVIYRQAQNTRITLRYADGTEQLIVGDQLDERTSRRIFERDGTIEMITVDLVK